MAGLNDLRVAFIAVPQGLVERTSARRATRLCKRPGLLGRYSVSRQRGGSCNDVDTGECNLTPFRRRRAQPCRRASDADAEIRAADVRCSGTGSPDRHRLIRAEHGRTRAYLTRWLRGGRGVTPFLSPAAQAVGRLPPGQPRPEVRRCAAVDRSPCGFARVASAVESRSLRPMARRARWSICSCRSVP